MIGIFAKEPVPGKVKTRLQSHLTPEQAAAVYEASMCDVIERAMSVAPVRLHYAGGESARHFFSERFPELPLVPQVQGDLGARMGAALASEFSAAAEVALILGTDSPTLPASHLQAAFDQARNHDVVFGPTEDGGYYLVGVRSEAWPAAAAIFQEIPWSTPDVLARSLKAAREANLSVGRTPPWYDVDHAPELLRALAESQPGSHLGRMARANPEIAVRAAAPPQS